MAVPVIGQLLTDVFNASLQLQYWPATFKEAVVVVIRKPGRATYSDPKSYRPISLIKTFSKTMEFIQAKRLISTAEIHKLLPLTHCGGRKSSSCEHAIHLLLEKIFSAWRSTNSKVASLLLLDGSGAFDNVNHQRLLWAVRRLGFRENLVGWLGSYLSGCSGQIRMTEGLMPRFSIEKGIPQGSPLSPILGLIYNLEIL